ncbi:IS1595 family transposase [Thermodesulfobacteriota bacterium]
MKMPQISLLEWQKRYGTEEACAATLAKYRWPQGFICPRCGHDSSWFITTRRVYQCCQCAHQVSVTAGTLFHSTNLPLVKWFWAIYLVASDKGGISALRLSKHLGVSWPTARSMLKKIRTAMVHRDSLYRLVDELIELDDTYVGGKTPGKRGRGAKGKKPILVAVEHKANTAGFVAMKAVESVSGKEIKSFLERHLNHGQQVRTDALPAMNIVEENHQHEKKITPPKEVSTWLPLVHIVIGNMKIFLNGTFHGVTHKYLQEYLDEFCYRFNRRFWEPELPLRLLNACLSHAPVPN